MSPTIRSTASTSRGTRTSSGNMPEKRFPGGQGQPGPRMAIRQPRNSRPEAEVAQRNSKFITSVPILWFRATMRPAPSQAARYGEPSGRTTYPPASSRNSAPGTWSQGSVRQKTAKWRSPPATSGYSAPAQSSPGTSFSCCERCSIWLFTRSGTKRASMAPVSRFRHDAR